MTARLTDTHPNDPVPVPPVQTGYAPEPVNNNPTTAGQADALLWKDLQAGSEKAYALLYRRYFGLLYHYGLHLNNDEDVVKDCIQDLFLYLWNHRETLTDVTFVKPYLVRALKGRLLNAFSKNARFDLMEDEETVSGLEITHSAEQELIDLQISQEQQDAIVRALDKLTGRQKEAVLLKFYSNRRNEEIAAEMAISLDAVYNLIYQAIGRLRNNVEKVYGLLLILWNML
ncbi:RNA polymerase sigma factor [Arsenicibacter rosenii]|uniref:RNA polymerase subunit sigma-24 n=1 Tax=Arsenicibacter rosenii TaxID=1750698 RepID=A0A1S2VDZ0_9BACT|nr:sigma-70 family RNA polymerase sigma factor [Arsenicibacter rosenii]OIN56640.1 hypothetical protein BLX24_23710 [Arsenicibacter rosenii]